MARPFFSEERTDGSKHYNRLEVDFGARNAFGGMVRGTAWVFIEEGDDGSCNVLRAELLDN